MDKREWKDYALMDSNVYYFAWFNKSSFISVPIVLMALSLSYSNRFKSYDHMMMMKDIN